MEINKVDGTARGDVFLYALSTCVWCKKTKRLLNNLGVAYRYIDVDLLDDRERQQIDEEIKRWNPRCSFPTLVIDGQKCIVGFKEDEIREELA